MTGIRSGSMASVGPATSSPGPSFR